MIRTASPGVVNQGFATNEGGRVSSVADIGSRRGGRFYALRLRETGFIKGNPKRIMETGTDWRSFNELRKELKA